MRENHLWNRAKNAPIQVGAAIAGDFDIGFDARIPEETRQALLRFICWVEEHFSLPVTLWVDFKYNHYLMDRNGKRVGYRFYWSDFDTYPVFENPEDIPVIELPVRLERCSLEEVLVSFIEAISEYYIWLTNIQSDSNRPDDGEAEEVLRAYLQDRGV